MPVAPAATLWDPTLGGIPQRSPSGDRWVNTDSPPPPGDLWSNKMTSNQASYLNCKRSLVSFKWTCEMFLNFKKHPFLGCSFFFKDVAIPCDYQGHLCGQEAGTELRN